jgi:hypothetical protein
VPSQVSVVSFDDGPLAENSRPTITSVHQPMAQLAHTAILQLIEMVNGRTPASRSVLPTRLVVRESSGPPRDSAGLASEVTVVAAVPPTAISREATPLQATPLEATSAEVDPTSRSASA